MVRLMVPLETIHNTHFSLSQENIFDPTSSTAISLGNNSAGYRKIRCFVKILNHSVNRGNK